MKHFNKILFIALALLPVIAVLGGLIATIGNDTPAGYVPLGTVSIEDRADGLYIVTEADSWASRIIDPITNQNPVTGVLEAFSRFLVLLQANAGIPVCLPVVCSILLMLYSAWVALVDMLVSLITFIPRKCSEIFR